ncbi:uncharacterized protein LOC114326045 [Diabrotica virgifera virgifera]|uniref:Uncharacterized protein LOC114326045 n=1 Tax=Diabrotica virgifera virgifera TaxID=50390 RepID=A0A6P7F3T4_DIAVI|nr:uncharacterized protein LOC114326045 [Diabrotica virgifera virgifera]
MKTVCFIFAALAVALVKGDEISDCKCNSLREPRKDPDGIVRCHAKRVFLLPVECNLPIYPDCTCSEPATAKTLTPDHETNRTEYSCTKYGHGKLIKKWPCENEDEWNKFYEEYPNLKPLTTATV